MTEEQHDVTTAFLGSLMPNDSRVDTVQSSPKRSEDSESSQSRNNSSVTNATSLSPSSITAPQSNYNFSEDGTSESSGHVELLDTTKALQQFSKIRQRIEDPITIEKNRDKWKKWKEDNEMHVTTLDMLKAWVAFTSADNLERFSMITRGKWNFDLPEPDELKSLARHYFPCLGDLRVRIIDFGDGRAHREETTLKEIHRCKSLMTLYQASYLLCLYSRDRNKASMGAGSLDVSDNST